MAPDPILRNAVQAVVQPLGFPAEQLDYLTDAVHTDLAASSVLRSVLEFAPVEWRDVDDGMSHPEFGTSIRSFCSSIYDRVFSSATWRREVGYDHPMDEDC